MKKKRIRSNRFYRIILQLCKHNEWAIVIEWKVKFVGQKSDKLLFQVERKEKKKKEERDEWSGGVEERGRKGWFEVERYWCEVVYSFEQTERWKCEQKSKSKKKRKWNEMLKV